MNTEESNFEACILNDLEPAIYDFQQLDDFISECIAQGKEQYPIHVKINTGMNRLGFETTEIEKVLEVIQAQPEVKIQSVYSHLADADNRRDKRFTELQLQKFGTVVILRSWIGIKSTGFFYCYCWRSRCFGVVI